MLSVGVDIVEIERLGRTIERWGQRFLDRVYTPREQAFCRGRVPELAARFAAKEAISKALGTGIIGPGGVSWLDMEVLPNRRGKPLVYLHGQARRRAEELGLTQWAISLAHERKMAIAFVVASGEGDTPRMRVSSNSSAGPYARRLRVREPDCPLPPVVVQW